MATPKDRGVTVYENSYLFQDRNNVVNEVKEKKIFRHKFVYSLHLCFSYFMCGWVLAQIGSALLDLQLITSASLEQVSLYQTFYNVGYLGGSFLAAVIYTRVNELLFQFFTLLGVGVTLAAVPWCSIHVVMVIAYCVIGIGCGIQDSVGNAEMLKVWGTQGLSFMQAMHFSYALGGILSPVVTGQFLSSRTTEMTSYNSNETTPAYNWTTFMPDIGINFIENQTHFLGESITLTPTEYSRILHNSTDDINAPTRLYIAYAISAGLCTTIALMFLILYFLIDPSLLDGRENASGNTPILHLNRSMQVLVLLTMGSMAAIYIGLEESFSGFINAFCVTYFHWSATTGSYATSVFYGSFGFGRLSAVMWANFINPRKILWLFCGSLVLIFTALTIAAIFKIQFFIWISSAITGIVMSIIYPTIFTWTEEVFFPVSGKVSGYFNFTSGIGGMVNPIIIGSLMDRYTPMWYCYILTGESVVLFIIYLIGVNLTKRVNDSSEIYERL